MATERTLLNIYSPALERSITGSIISMLSFLPKFGSEINIVGADVYGLTADLAHDFCQTLILRGVSEEREIQDEFKKMLLSEENYNRRKYNVHRLFSLVIEGKNAVEEIKKLLGDMSSRDGVTILGRYGFLSRDKDDQILAIEFPASAPSCQEEAEAQIELVWSKYKSCGSPLKNAITYSPAEKASLEYSVVLVKPNAFNQPNDPRLGDVMDAISRTGMYIVGAKVLTSTREQMEQFYAPHKGKEFFERLVNFMSGKKSIALLYEGVEARRKIRETALTVIREAYSDSLLENTVHTSENEEDFQREYKAVNFEVNNLPG